MKIKQVRAFPVQYPEPNDNNNLRTITLVNIEADDGTVGWGECVTMWVEASHAVKTIVEDGLAALLIGRDPLDNGALWADMKGHCWWYGEGGIASFAISALDMALWDLKGKILGLPLYKLLGGKLRDRLRVCASTHPALPDIDDLAQELAEHVRNGYTAVKVGFGKLGEAELGKDPARDVAYVRAVREAIGDKADFMVDMGKKNRYDTGQTIRLVREFEAYNLRWIEDPFLTRDYESHHRLQMTTQTPIAVGERSWTVAQYKTLIDAKIAQIFLVDPGRVEGITATYQIITLLTEADCYFNAHTWSSALNTAASIHLAAAAPNYVVLELKPRPNPMQHELVTEPIEPKDGWVDVLEKPGLGVEVNEKIVEKYTLD